MINPTKTLAMCEAATEGPWETRCDFDGYTDPEPEVIQSGHEDHGYSVVIAQEIMQRDGADAEFIAQARTELPAYAAFTKELIAEFEEEDSDFFQGRGYCYDNFRRLAAKYGIRVE